MALTWCTHSCAVLSIVPGLLQQKPDVLNIARLQWGHTCIASIDVSPSMGNLHVTFQIDSAEENNTNTFTHTSRFGLTALCAGIPHTVYGGSSAVGLDWLSTMYVLSHSSHAQAKSAYIHCSEIWRCVHAQIYTYIYIYICAYMYVYIHICMGRCMCTVICVMHMVHTCQLLQSGSVVPTLLDQALSNFSV